MTASIYDLIAHIESPTFDAEMNVFSGFNSFYNAIQQDQYVIDLVNLGREIPEKMNEVAARIAILLKEGTVKPEFANPHDVALAVYFYSLEQTNRLPNGVWEAVFNVSSLWWTRCLASRILEQRKTEIAAVTVEIPQEKMASVDWQPNLYHIIHIRYEQQHRYAPSVSMVSKTKVVSSSKTKPINYPPYTVTRLPAIRG